MSDPKRIKPPRLNLGNFGAPPLPDQGRPSFYAEESTMITALSDVERKRLASGEARLPTKPDLKSPDESKIPPAMESASPPPPTTPKAPPPTASLVSLNSLNTAPNSKGPHEQGGSNLTPVTPMFETQSPPVIQGNSKGAPPPIPLPNQEASGGVESDHTSEVTPQDLRELNQELERSSAEIGSAPTNAGTLGNGIVVVFNARGGVGASTLAVNVAGAAQYLNQRVALIDLDLQLGSLSSMLDGKPLERSLAELVVEASESSSGGIHSAIDERSGLSLIAQEGRIGEIGMVTPDRLPRFLEAVRAQHDLVIIDGVRSFSDHAVTAMDIADTILVVVTQDVPALRSARKVISLAKRLGYNRGKVRLVLNRHHKRSALSIEEIEDRLDYPFFEVLPNDFKFVSSLIEQGCLARDMNLKHPITAGFDRLATQLLGLEPPKPKGFFGRLFNKRGK